MGLPPNKLKLRCFSSCFVFFSLLFFPIHGISQFLSHLQATKEDALFTTYAAVPQRSHYKNDQGYQLQWTDPEEGLEFFSKDGPNIGIGFQMDNQNRFQLEKLYREPVITTSYSDLVNFFYYPFPDFRVEVFFIVYSSEKAFVKYRLFNEGNFPMILTAFPYCYFPATDSINRVIHHPITDGYHFPLKKMLDNWMVDHDIPLYENLQGTYRSTLGFDNVLTFSLLANNHNQVDDPLILTLLKKSIVSRVGNAKMYSGLLGSKTFRLQPHDATSFIVEVELQPLTDFPHSAKEVISGKVDEIDPEMLIKQDEIAYSKIPTLKFANKDKEMLYWSAFSLMRQCFMPPEGECHHNYYVFSREPRWGWGYGGQVFHESLSMLAYVYMDPAGAMNSQRVYMDRQHQDGYVNYRTGPYLNETIGNNGHLTTSAPWFNYINLEIYKVTNDKQFLKQAYESGKRFYQYFVATRDSNQNGLCEWGAHAELESVRDARVAVWDQVGWPSNFEGPDLNSMLVKEAKCLSVMAKSLGLQGESSKWIRDAEQRTQLINKNLWDHETSFYYNTNKFDHSFSFRKHDDLKIREIIGFLPLWAGVADRNKAAMLVQKMQDTTEFWRPYGVPSLSARSDYYCPIGYWNGPVWVQWEYLLYQGLHDYGYHQVAEDLSNRVLSNMIYHLKKDHVFWEFYSADDLQAGWNKTYIWAGVALKFLLPYKTHSDSDRQ